MNPSKNAILARRVACELTDEETQAVSGGSTATAHDEDWRRSLSPSSSSSTNERQDGDVSVDF